MRSDAHVQTIQLVHHRTDDLASIHVKILGAHTAELSVCGGVSLQDGRSEAMERCSQLRTHCLIQGRHGRSHLLTSLTLTFLQHLRANNNFLSWAI